MSRTITERDLRDQTGEILDAVADGETFIITRNGDPVAALGPPSRDRGGFTSKQDLVRHTAALPHMDAIALRRDLDAVIEPHL